MPTEKNTLFQDDETQKRIHEHLTSEKDVISDEDIDNVKTDIGETSPDPMPAEENESPASEPAEIPGTTKKDDDEEPRIETPWNILK